MADMNELYGKLQEKKKLERQRLILVEQEKIAEKDLLDCRVRCQKENLDIKKFESNEFKQFWYKLRGEFEARQLENAANAAAAMRALHDAQARAFDISIEKKNVEEQIESLKGIEKEYEKSLEKTLEHLDYSIHREAIIRMQQKIANDGYQLKVLQGAENLLQLSDRKISQIITALMRVKDAEKREKAFVRDEAQIVISLYSELRVLFFHLDQELSQVDSVETEDMHFASCLQIKATDIFYNKRFTEDIDSVVLSRAIQELEDIQRMIEDEEDILTNLFAELTTTRELHKEALEKFIVETSAESLT